MRFQTTKVCAECAAAGINCADRKKCAPIRTAPRSYGGIRHTADGFDCALPVTIDSHSSCAYECLYCFSDNILGHSTAHNRTDECHQVGETSLRAIENIFADKNMERPANRLTKMALRYDKRNAGGFPCAVQLGGLCDPGDSIEQNHGWLLDFMDLAIKYDQPVRMSTKGGVFLLPEYLKKIAIKPHLFWVAFSTITDDDNLLQQVDRYATTASQRIQSVKNLTAIGVKTSLRLRPMIVGITDKNRAYESLIRKFADAGARAISYEVGFYPRGIPKNSKWKWAMLNKLCGHDLKSIYSSFGKLQACTRPSYLWTENIMHRVKEIAHDCGMVVGVSDPVWKQLSDVGCCCGISPDDPVFGNWEPENATNAMLVARTTGKEIHFADIAPPWAFEMSAGKMVNYGAGPTVLYRKTHETWADKLREVWNDIGKERSAMNYFQGALEPCGFDERGDRIYRYKGLQRRRLKTEWNA